MILVPRAISIYDTLVHEYLFTSKQEFFEPWIKVNRNNILYTFTTLITTIWPKNLPRTYNVSFPPGSVFPLEQILRYKSNVRSVGLADLIESAVDVSRMGKSFSRASNKTERGIVWKINFELIVPPSITNFAD